MRIGVNTRFLLKGKLEGIGNYTHEVVSRMVKNHPEHEFVFFFDRPFHEQFVYAKNVKPVVISPPARHPYLWKLWFDFCLPRAFKKHKIDCFFSPDSFLSLRTSVPQYVVVHDLAFEHLNDGVAGIVQKYYKKYVPLFCEKAKGILTVSEFTKKDIQSKYGVKRDKIDVALNGVSLNFKVLNEEQKTQVKQKYTAKEDYFVFVGAMHPRKNIVGLLKAFDEFKALTKSSFKLCIVGRKGWGNAKMEHTFLNMNYSKDVVFTDRVSNAELSLLIGAAHALVYVPFFEGFGLPILEAHACGVPVVCSHTSSMPEVGGKAVLLADPHSVKSVSSQMIKLLDQEVYAKLKLETRANVNKFSWDKTEEDVWGSIKKGF